MNEATMNQTEKLTRNDIELSRTGSYNDAAAAKAIGPQ
jgi:hypothetical protein